MEDFYITLSDDNKDKQFKIAKVGNSNFEVYSTQNELVSIININPTDHASFRTDKNLLSEPHIVTINNTIHLRFVSHQDAWISILKRQNIPGWLINADEEDIIIKCPEVNYDVVVNNFPDVISSLKLSLLPYKSRQSFVLTNGKSPVTFVLNPDEKDLKSDLVRSF